MTRVHIGGLVLAALVLSGCAQTPVERETLYQVSTIQSLLAGNYDGDVAVETLLRYGDVGLGTFDDLDGEMVVLNGIPYQVPASGSVTVASGATETPFAAVTWFEPDLSFRITEPMTFEAVKKEIDRRLPSENLPCAIRITGWFSSAHTRSVPRQSKPYPPLAEVTRSQPEFRFGRTEGDVVGLRLPGYFKELNVSGHHHHFLTRDRTGGGHVLNYVVENGVVELDFTSEFRLVLPASEAFYGTDLTRDRTKELESVEQGHRR